MSVEANKRAAREFVEEALDGGNYDVIRSLFLPTAIRHFPAADLTIDPSPPEPLPPGRLMRTEIHHLYGEGNYVTIHLTHHVTFAPRARFTTRLGTVDVGGRSVEWNAMVVLRFEGGRIAEEWVNRDELQVLLQLGILKPLEEHGPGES